MYGVVGEKRPVFVESDAFLYNIGDHTVGRVKGKKNDRLVNDMSRHILPLHTLKSTGRHQYGRFFTNFSDHTVDPHESVYF